MPVRPRLGGHAGRLTLAHKLREAMASGTAGARPWTAKSRSTEPSFGGHIRPANFVENRVDRRLAKHQTGKRRVVIALRQRKGRALPA